MPLRSKPSSTFLLLGCLLLAACDLFVSAEARVDRAATHIADGDYREAMIELKNALQDQPDNVDARLMLARVSLQLGDLEAADKELRRAVEAGATPERVGNLRYDLLVAQRKFPDALTFLDTDSTIAEADKLYYTAVAELGVQDVAAARQAAEALLAGHPADVRGHVQMAEVLAAEGKTDAAIAEVRKALQNEPANAMALWTEGRLLVTAGRWEEAEKSLVAATGQESTLDATTRAAALAALTEAHFGQQDLAAAKESIARLEKLAPGSPGSRLLKARLALAENRPADAVAELEPVVQGLPDYLPAQLMMGAALMAQGSYERAESHLLRITSRWPNNPQANRMLAEVRLRLGRPEAARDALASFGAETGDAQTDWLMGQALWRSGSQAEALEFLERSAKAEPGNLRLQTELAAAYLEVGRVEDALQLLEPMQQGAADGRRDSLLVLAYAAQGKGGRGRNEVEKLASEHPDDARILGLVGAYMQRTGDFAAARDYLNRATRAAPDDAAPWVALADLEYRAGNRDAARTALQRAQAVDDGSEAAALGLARIAFEQGSPAEAIEILDKAIAENPQATRARLALAQLSLQNGNEDRARALFDQVIEASPDRVAALNAVGGIQLRSGQVDQAIATFERAVAEQPSNAEALYALGAAQIAKKDVAAGRRNLEAAAERRPGWIQPSMLLTMLDVNAGRVDEALERAKAVRAANPGNVTAIALEADVLAAAGRNDEALKAYAEAQAARSTGQVALRMMELRKATGASPIEQPVLDHLELQPADVFARRRLAEHYQIAGDRPKAIAQYEELTAVAPRDAAATNNLAWLYYEVGDERAESTARKAHEISPGNGAITDTLGWIVVEKGDLDAGIELLRRALEQAPNVPDIRYHLAAALARDGQREDATAILQELLKSDTGFQSRPQAEKLLKELSR